jgi:lysophospholipase L1-like esterase
MALLFDKGSKILFIGDSITDCDRNNPNFEPWGDGYVRDIHRLLQCKYPQLDLTSLNQGISGDRVTDLQSRWKSDVLALNPDWVFIYIGINDVWRFFEGDLLEGVTLSAFTKTYRTLISDTLSTIPARMRLINPFLGEPDPTDPFRSQLTRYQSAIADLGQEFSIPVIPLQPAFDHVMLAKHPQYWTSDRVHPSKEGHMLIALTILKACGFEL